MNIIMAIMLLIAGGFPSIVDAVTNNVTINIKAPTGFRAEDNIAIEIADRTFRGNAWLKNYIIPLSQLYGGGFALLRYDDFGTFWTSYKVTQYDDNGAKLASGEVQCALGATPLAAVELKTDSRDLPQQLRGKWIMGIVIRNTPKLPTHSFQTKLVPEGRQLKDDLDYVTPIRWERGKNDDQDGSRIFSDTNSTFEFR